MRYKRRILVHAIAIAAAVTVTVTVAASVLLSPSARGIFIAESGVVLDAGTTSKHVSTSYIRLDR